MKNFLKTKNYKLKTNSGQAMLISVIFFLFISLSIIAGLVSPSVREFKIANDAIHSRQSFFLAESGVEDAYYRIVRNGTLPASGTQIIISLNGATASTTIIDTSASIKTITSLGDLSLRQRKSELKITSGDGVTFRYGTQAGQGGIIFQENSFLSGNLYSNGNIVGANNAYITGNVFVAGNTGSISNMCLGGMKTQGSSCAVVGGVTGNTHAHTVTGSHITGALYCQVGGTGNNANNKACNTTLPVPVAIDLPVTEAQITAWKVDAAAISSNNVTGNLTISTNQTIGPMKIVGNLTISGTPIVTIADTVWVTGNIFFNGGQNTVIKLASTYGNQSGIIIADGYINVGNNMVFEDSGTLGSYIMILSTSVCDENTSVSSCNGKNAITINNNANIVIANAQNGTISFANNATVKEVVGQTIRLKQNVGIYYGTGVINVGFTSGPSGSWGISSWQEK